MTESEASPSEAEAVIPTVDPIVAASASELAAVGFELRQSSSRLTGLYRNQRRQINFGRIGSGPGRSISFGDAVYLDMETLDITTIESGWFRHWNATPPIQK